jgi:hypothetical protein
MPTLLITLLRRFGIQIVVMAAIAVGGWWLLHRAEQRGWDRRDAQAQAEAHAAEQRAGEIILENIADAADRDRAVATQIEALNLAASARAKTLNDHLAAQEAIPFQPRGTTHDDNLPVAGLAPAPAFSAHPLLGQSVLDRRTVGLLNDARAGLAPAPGSAPAGADAEGEATASSPTAITGRIFADNDLEVVRLYHELATRHNGLVDWVNHQCVPEKPQPTP